MDCYHTTEHGYKRFAYVKKRTAKTFFLQEVEHFQTGHATMNTAAPITIEWDADKDVPVRKAKVDSRLPAVLISGNRYTRMYWYPVKAGAKFSQPLTWTEA